MPNPFEYVARDLVTWEPLDPLPYRSVSFGKALNSPGAWQGSIPLASPSVQALDWKGATRPSRTALFVDLFGTLVWGGILWTCNYDSTSKENLLELGGTEFGSLFQHRLQAADYSKTWEFGGDPMEVAKRVIEDALTAELPYNGAYTTGVKIPVVLNPPSGSGQSIPVSYPAASLQTIDSIVSTLSQMGFGAGFDFSVDVAYNASKVPSVSFSLFYPLKGRTAQENGLVVAARDTVKWTYPEDGTVQAVEVTETGGGETEPETATVDLPDYPLLQKVTSRSQITTNALLAEIAIGDLATYEYPSVTPSVVIPVASAGSPSSERGVIKLGEFDVGDRLMFQVDPTSSGTENTDPRFPEGMEYEWRLGQWTCTPQDSGLSVVQLDLGMPPLGYVPAPAPPH